ncbi:phosphoribosylformylglycinamidine synthase subunit PurQ [Desulfobacula sp.]|uniref:phosphoribosylformylglycinamidine synthase subunit PurQ n=1 Tax=Desulfobacula sp. TaxID=2593537 RepID=UPI00260EEEA6|nr:phosphoribosylformylglycinamidine synthase subunit PurQ [Desulfobacula sp.]
MKKVNALILTGFGLNCDTETAHAFELAGATSHRVHINALISGKVALEDFHILALGGGFSWGDDHGAGVIEALKLKNHIGRALLTFVDQGKLIIGICNGFQALVNLGLLPGLDRDYTRRSVSITFNDCGNFRDQWVHLAANTQSPCVFTKNMETVDYPIRHGEGKVIADPQIIDTLLAGNQVVFQYADAAGVPAKGAFPLNPNGSLEDIAGICDPTGKIFGLMPHPEAYTHVTNHPDWTRRAQVLKRAGKSLDQEMTIGVKLFKNGVDHIKDAFFK